MNTIRLRLALLLNCVNALLCGCAAIPTSAPDLQSPDAWHAPLPHGGRVDQMTQWWKQYDDSVVSELIELAEADNPTLTRAWANIQIARATLTTERAGGLPGLDLSGSASRGTQQTVSTAGTAGATDRAVYSRNAGADAAWEIDLFGKVRHGVAAAQARIEARIDDWHEARVSLAAEVADRYVQYRACLLLTDAYLREAASKEQTLNATESSVRAGFTAPADGALARASLASTKSSLTLQRAECELQVKSLVNLTGASEPQVREMLARGPNKVPEPGALTVHDVPADVLRQRPDLAATEREFAAAAAEVGVAQADLYPTLTLSGSISVTTGDAFGSSYTSWSFGPSLSIPLFDSGRRRAAVDRARASYLAAFADYQQDVRDAVNEVERALVNLDSTAQRAIEAERAAQEYRRYFQALEINWRAGGENLLALEDARRSALAAEIQYITLQRDRVSHWIALYKSLGGGWEPGTPAMSPQNLATANERNP